MYKNLIIPACQFEYALVILSFHCRRFNFRQITYNKKYKESSRDLLLVLETVIHYCREPLSRNFFNPEAQQRCKSL